MRNSADIGHVGEMARVLITPLQHPAASRLHPIVNSN